MHKPLIVYVDMDDTLCGYTSTLLDHRRQNPERPFPQSMPGFFRNLPPLSGAIEGYQWLNSQRQFEIYILTAPSLKNPLCYTEKRLWVEAHLGMEAVSRMVISPNKGLSKGDFLIDDNVTGKGQECFEGTLIHFGSAEFVDWPAIIHFFKQFTNPTQPL